MSKFLKKKGINDMKKNKDAGSEMGVSFTISKQLEKLERFLEGLDRTLPLEERHKRYIEFAFGTDCSYLRNQAGMPDAEERMAALMDVFSDAMVNDEEDWSEVGKTMIAALCNGNVSYFMYALCGQSLESLARKAMLIRDEDYEFHSKEMAGQMVVQWSNGEEIISDCLVDVGTLGVYGYSDHLFDDCGQDDAVIEDVLVEVQPLCNGATYRFQCVAMEDMMKSGDCCLYWYAPDPKCVSKDGLI